ncbi:MAG: methyltransferase domain-containing protein [Rivularia sp. T60_A2020_040]|nr:methyltransferase domain-containing protein [Rivularia sp. T60_A2020_040]
MSEANNEITPLHTLNPLHRFSDRVEYYVKYRPSYPTVVIDKILENLTSLTQLVAADIGAGTGISSRLLAARGVKVIAVEPNAEMRNAAENHSNVEWKDGTAENTNLPDASVDLITCFQAFHWFTPEPTLSEFRRILKPQGRLAVVWNNRDLLAAALRDRNDEFTAEYSRIVRVASNNHPAESRIKTVEYLTETTYFKNFYEYNFDYQQELDKSGLIGRAMSSSYVPRKGETYEQVISELENLYQQFKNQQGFVYMTYSTSLHLGEVN